MNHSYILILILLIAFGIYRRIRRNIGFQKLSPKSLRIRLIIFLIIGLMIIASSFALPFLYISDAGGIVLGLLLAYLAITTTKFEIRNEHWYYRPNAWIGGVVIAIFLGRLLYGFLLMNHSLGNLPLQGSTTSGTYVRNPWTAGIIFILIAYYGGYYLFLLRKARQLPPVPSNS
ncbi:MAG TPA: CcdC protein domain-containing protein [Bacillales bacterium]|nr:CcdC protein domain-containing protein [Bacillales bacterium]